MCRSSFYLIGLKGCRGIVFTNGGVGGQPSGLVGIGQSLSELYLRNRKV